MNARPPYGNLSWCEVPNLEAPYMLLLWNWAPQGQNKDGLLGPNSIVIVYMEPLGNCLFHKVLLTVKPTECVSALESYS